MKHLLILITIVFAPISALADEWKPLFDGKSLEGWAIKSGFATYRVEDGAIVGKTVEGSENTFLCTEQEFGDFELQFEVKVDKGLNSGVQIRSKLKAVEVKRGVEKKNQYGGRVYGPQVEIEASPGQAGFIYGEATGLKWLSEQPKSKDKSINQHDHFLNDQWNSFRVVA